MKSYTDIEQSKVLAKILPIESADMYYPWDIDSKSFLNIPIVKDDSYYVQGSIPCWSLTALLGIFNYPDLIKEHSDKWTVRAWDRGNQYVRHGLSNPVDACYDMIMELHKNNVM